MHGHMHMQMHMHMPGWPRARKSCHVSEISIVLQISSSAVQKAIRAVSAVLAVAAVPGVPCHACQACVSKPCKAFVDVSYGDTDNFLSLSTNHGREHTLFSESIVE